MVTAAMKLIDACSLEEKLDNLDNILDNLDIKGNFRELVTTERVRFRVALFF